MRKRSVVLSLSKGAGMSVEREGMPPIRPKVKENDVSLYLRMHLLGVNHPCQRHCPFLLSELA